MPNKLPLAVDIADTVSEAAEKGSALDVETKADELHDEHPEAEVSRSDIADTLREESEAAGVEEHPQS
jgi:hypothetical protein